MSITKAPRITREIMVGEDKVIIDTHNMTFNEHNLNEFMSEMKGWYSYYNAMWSEMDKIASDCETRYENAFNIHFTHYKEKGMDVKRAEALAKLERDVMDAKDLWVEAIRRTNLLKGELRSLDKAHESAQGVGHNLRKEMDKLNPEIYATRHSGGAESSGGTATESRVAEMMRRAREKNGESDPNE